jgi:hypothetical protein
MYIRVNFTNAKKGPLFSDLVIFVKQYISVSIRQFFNIRWLGSFLKWKYQRSFLWFETTAVKDKWFEFNDNNHSDTDVPRLKVKREQRSLIISNCWTVKGLVWIRSYYEQREDFYLSLVIVLKETTKIWIIAPGFPLEFLI